MYKDNRTYQKAFIMDMDGVVYTASQLIFGAGEFVGRLQHSEYKFLFLTNNSCHKPLEIRQRLMGLGIDVPEYCFCTSAMAAATFFRVQRPEVGSAYVIGGPGIVDELKNAEITITSDRSDYVIVVETEQYDYAKIISRRDRVENAMPDS